MDEGESDGSFRRLYYYIALYSSSLFRDICRGA